MNEEGCTFRVEKNHGLATNSKKERERGLPSTRMIEIVEKLQRTVVDGGFEIKVKQNNFNLHQPTAFVLVSIK